MKNIMRAEACATNLVEHDYNKFWSSVSKINNSKATKYANSVGGAIGEEDVSKMWSDHFNQLYNSVSNDGAKNAFYDRLATINSPSVHIISVSDVINAIKNQKCGKAVGLDGIAMESIIYGGLRLSIHLCLLFNMFIKYQYLPESFMRSVIVPLVKCKSGDLSDVNNYRAIAVSSALSKLFESVLSSLFSVHHIVDDYQFGFKPGHSTGLCTRVLKQTVDYYTQRGSHVFACFVDFSKAFDKVNYWKLFNKLLDDNIDSSVIGIFAFWYSHQQACVRWQNTITDFFHIGNGTRQGGVLSPTFFVRYIRDLVAAIISSRIGCAVGSLCINVLAYADDLVLLTPAWGAMQQLINIFVEQIKIIDMTCNVRKTMCMVFSPKNRSKIVANSFPLLKIDAECIQYVQNFKYLGHFISNDLCDDVDIQREIRNMFVRVNVLLRKFSKCSVRVKTVLFKAFCICLYDVALWTSYSVTIFNKFQSCYNKCMKIFFGYRRSYSVTLMLGEIGLPSFNTIIFNSCASFTYIWSNSSNNIINYMNSIRCGY